MMLTPKAFELSGFFMPFGRADSIWAIQDSILFSRE